MSDSLGVPVTDPFVLSPKWFLLYKNQFNQWWVPDIHIGIIWELSVKDVVVNTGNKGFTTKFHTQKTVDMQLPIYCLQSTFDKWAEDGLFRIVVMTSFENMPTEEKSAYLAKVLDALQQKLRDLHIEYESSDDSLIRDARSQEYTGTVMIRTRRKVKLESANSRI